METVAHPTDGFHHNQAKFFSLSPERPGRARCRIGYETPIPFVTAPMVRVRLFVHTENDRFSAS
jgi:hypothetical protein